MVNKVFEAIGAKLAAIHDLSRHRRVLLVTAPAPLNESITVAPTSETSASRDGHSVKQPPPRAFLGYGAAPAFYGQPLDRPYDYDIGFSGNAGRFDERYAWRLATMGDGQVLARLRRRGVRVYEGGMVGAAQYILTLASTRIWLATSEAGDHVTTRAYEVLASGRSLLLCDRNARAHARLGIVEGVNAAMFNSSAEFESKVRWYMEHEGERLRLVRAARALANFHTWGDRARELTTLIREQLHDEHGGQRATSRQPAQALARADGQDGLRRPVLESGGHAYSWARSVPGGLGGGGAFDAPCERAFVFVESIVRT